jgi:hypothetical protein
MAQKVKLSLDPKDRISFEREISIPTPDGKPVKITFEFKYRTREQTAELLDSYVTKAKASAEAAKGKDNAEQVDQAIRNDVQAIKEVATNWNVDGHAFDDETLAQFVSMYPGAPMAILRDYHVGMTEGRLGN